MIGQAMELADILKKHGPSPQLHELWHDAMPKILETVKIMDSKIEKMGAVVEAVRDWNTDHNDLCKSMIERCGRRCSCGYDDINNALKALEEK